MKKKYKEIWLCFVNITPKQEYGFSELVENSERDNYIGAWANIIVKSNDIKEAIDIVYAGLDEKNFKVEFIDQIQNIESLIKNDELNDSIIKEINWLIKSKYVFIISDKLFPYTDEN